jgi:hypothetical protein
VIGGLGDQAQHADPDSPQGSQKGRPVGQDILHGGTTEGQQRKENTKTVPSEADQDGKLYHDPSVLLHERRLPGMFYIFARSSRPLAPIKAFAVYRFVSDAPCYNTYVASSADSRKYYSAQQGDRLPSARACPPFFQFRRSGRPAPQTK